MWIGRRNVWFEKRMFDIFIKNFLSDNNIELMLREMKKHKNIRRIDNDVNRTHAWLVQVQRNKKITIKMFTDGVFGGKRKAFNAALKFRNGVLAGISEYKYHMHIRSILRKNNKSGIPGVGRYDAIQKIKDRKAAFWTAFWDDENGKRRSRKFYVSCYGERNAKKMAVSKRKEMLKKVCAAKCV